MNHRRRALSLVVGSIGWLIVGCSGDGADESHDGKRPVERQIPVTHDQDVVSDALLGGELKGTPTCLWLEAAEGRLSGLVLGSDIRTVKEGDITVVFDGDQEVARTGSQVTVRGGQQSNVESCVEGETVAGGLVVGSISVAPAGASED